MIGYETVKHTYNLYPYSAGIRVTYKNIVVKSILPVDEDIYLLTFADSTSQTVSGDELLRWERVGR
jgi:hypothetical protein